MHSSDALMDKGWNFRAFDGDPAVPLFPYLSAGSISGSSGNLFYVLDGAWCLWLGVDSGAEIHFHVFEYDVGLDVVGNYNLLQCFELAEELQSHEALV